MQNSFIYTNEQKEQVRNYLAIYLDSYENEGLANLEEYFFKPWSENKYSNSLFRELFKDSLRVKRQIKYSVPFLNIQNNDDHVRAWVLKVRDFRQKVMNHIRAITEEYYYGWTFESLVEDMLNNITYTTEEYVFKLNEKTLKINSNTTVTKAIRKVLVFYSIKEEIMCLYEDLLFDRSLLIQATNIEGTLVLSIDPMDIITASDNKCNWSSCFSLQNEGECKASVYSAVIDPHIMIAYLEAPIDCEFQYGIKTYNYSNKIWRAWVYYDENILFVNKNYPFNSQIITDYIYNWIFSIKDSIFIKSSNINGQLYDYNSFMYWDYRYGMPFYVEDPDSYNREYDDRKYFDITLGIAPNCLISGFDLNDNSSFISEEFWGVQCDECGDYYREDELLYVDGDDMWVCPNCFDEYYATCASCGYVYRVDKMELDEETGERYCDCCVKEGKHIKLRDE